MSDGKGPIDLHFFDGLRSDSIATTMLPAPAPKVFEVTLTARVVAASQDEAKDVVNGFLTALAEQDALYTAYRKSIEGGWRSLAGDALDRITSGATKIIRICRNITFGAVQKVT